MTQLKSEANALLHGEHDHDQEPTYEFQCDLRYRGTESTLALAMEPPATLASRFEQMHLRTFGYVQQDRDVEVVAVRCEATLHSKTGARLSSFVAAPATAETSGLPPARGLSAEPRPDETIRLWHDASWVDAALIDRVALRKHQTIEGPAMIVGQHSTLVVEPGWKGEVIEDGIIELNPTRAAAETVELGQHVPPTIPYCSR